MTTTTTIRELEVGDVVRAHGMVLLVDRAPQTRQTSPHGDVYWTETLLLNADDPELDPWLVGITRQYRAWPERHVPTGEHRWTLQGNDLASVAVERGAGRLLTR